MLRVRTTALWLGALGLFAGCEGGDGELRSCGNAIVERSLGEECDDGPANGDDDACTQECLVAHCGDGFVFEGVELCDEGPDNRDEGPCTPQCAPPSCGDGILQASELCDDGEDNTNILHGLGGCSPQCTPLPRCGDGAIDPRLEECDDGNDIDTDECTSHCKLPSCGDGIQQSGEECDDGNTYDNDACTSTCLKSRCGDGITWEGVEECDDGNQENSDSCLTTCVSSSCGDGVLFDGVEECDDGNIVDDDGCNAECSRDRLVFVTEESYSIAELGSLDVTYLRCGQEAQKAGLPNPMRFRAWTSNGVDSPSSRFDHSAGRYVLPTGDVIAYGWDDLTDGELLRPIDRSADGTLLHEVGAWTGTKPDGTAYLDGHCHGWSTPSLDKARYGFNDLVNQGWSDYVSEFGADCGLSLHLYCFEARL